MEDISSEELTGLIQDLLAGPAFPDKEFVRSGATFAQVYEMAAWVRTALADPKYQGAGVCLAADNRAIMAAALLASLAGGPTLLLPYAFSPHALDRLQQMTGYTCALSDVSREFPEGVKILCPPSGHPALTPLAIHGTPESELLKIFTGGSTGTPLFWSKTGMNIFAEGLFLARQFNVTENDRIAATISPYHIYGLLFSVVLPLVASATVLAQSPSFPGEIVNAVQQSEATILAAIPAHYRALRGRKLLSPSLRLAFSSAGMLDAADNADFQMQNRIGIVEVYGSTETGGVATRNRSRGEEHFTAFPTVDWKIKEHLLAVRSPYISPDASFDEDGFFTAADRVEDFGNNSFALMGRADTITKVGGKRVDLEEVSRLIKQEAGVTDCVVMALPESGGRENRIAALIQGKKFNLDTIRQKLAARLEPYALPRLIKTVDRIPLNNNGKYDRKAIARLLVS